MADTPTKTTKPAKDSTASETNGAYVTPITHTHLPKPVVDAAFWGGLAGAIALGLVDPPLGILIGAGVVVARHR